MRARIRVDAADDAVEGPLAGTAGVLVFVFFFDFGDGIRDSGWTIGRDARKVTTAAQWTASAYRY